jgi:hypothetical protein
MHVGMRKTVRGGGNGNDRTLIEHGMTTGNENDRTRNDNPRGGENSAGMSRLNK